MTKPQQWQWRTRSGNPNLRWDDIPTPGKPEVFYMQMEYRKKPKGPAS